MIVNIGARSSEVALRALAFYKSIHSLLVSSDKMILDISPHSRSESDFLISHRGRCWGASIEIFKSIHSLQYWSDWTDTHSLQYWSDWAENPNIAIFLS